MRYFHYAITKAFVVGEMELHLSMTYSKLSDPMLVMKKWFLSLLSVEARDPVGVDFRNAEIDRITCI